MKATPEFLRKIVLEVIAESKAKADGKVNSVEDVKADEVDADEHGQDKVKEKNPVDWLKVLDLKEQKAISYIKKIREAKAKLSKKLGK